MTILGYIFFLGLGLAGCALTGAHGYRKGYQKGLEDGERAFWARTEQEVDEARKEIWQAEPKTGRWL
jgi:hypothetical protein